MPTEILPAFQFEFTGVRLCLDFANTLSDRALEEPREHLNTYADLLAWSVQANILEHEQAQRLQHKAEQHPAEAEAVLQRAIELREAIYRIYSAIAEEETSAEADLLLLSNHYAEAMQHGRLLPSTTPFTWSWASIDALDRMLWPVAQSAVEVLTSDEVHSVRVCAADDCQWLFLDTSKNHSRRWCDMKSCGNRAKARRFYQRTRQFS